MNNTWYGRHVYSEDTNSLSDLHQIMLDSGLEKCPICHKVFVSYEDSDL